MKQKLLILEDDLTLNETLVDFFEELNYEVVPVYDGEDAYSKIYESNFDLFVLDVNVPSMNGFELLKNVRAQNIHTPAIYMTSLNSMDNLEEGYDSGCDDYIRKPFLLKELHLRVKTILNRSFHHVNDEKLKITDSIYFDINTNILYNQNEPCNIKNKEAKLLKFFLQNKDQIITHDRIYEALWEYDEDFSENALRTYIKNIRKIIGKEKIVSIKKLGYRFTSQ
ncbi:two-component system response regulator [Arcobacter sp. 31_11_sub10_T18]|mgnify:CR=1 FL=1|nr:two-component system response regulator [Arcobacter sp. 31_11_sub10_T18]